MKISDKPYSEEKIKKTQERPIRKARQEKPKTKKGKKGHKKRNPVPNCGYA
jgi:hypothetical protein